MSDNSKIAIASDDEITVTSHLGRCANFIIYEFTDGRFARLETRTNEHALNHAGGCAGHSSEGHDHGDLATALAGCRLVIAGGAGRRAVADLNRAGIQVLAAPEACEIQLAIRLLLSGALRPAGEHACGCNH
jgi:predicted Fe-Mo cluster-binding NifX family protein